MVDMVELRWLKSMLQRSWKGLLKSLKSAEVSASGGCGLWLGLKRLRSRAWWAKGRSGWEAEPKLRARDHRDQTVPHQNGYSTAKWLRSMLLSTTHYYPCWAAETLSNNSVQLLWCFLPCWAFCSLRTAARDKLSFSPFGSNQSLESLE